LTEIDRGLIAELMERERDRFAASNPESRRLHERAEASLLSGVPMNWMTRWPGEFPIFLASAEGAEVTDVDGNAASVTPGR
jgi:glutamate-1-semialdehyde 2,1-aminomutase